MVKFCEIDQKSFVYFRQRFFFLELLVSSEEQIRTEEFFQHIIVRFFIIVHLFIRFDGYSSHSKHKLEQQQTRISVMSDIGVVKIFGVVFDEVVFEVKLCLFGLLWGHYLLEHVLGVFDVGEMRNHL